MVLLEKIGKVRQNGDPFVYRQWRAVSLMDERQGICGTHVARRFASAIMESLQVKNHANNF